MVLVLPFLHMNLPQVYMCSPSCTPLLLPSPYHPSGSSQCTSHKHPISCIKPGLEIRFIYDIIHVSMPLWQITPPSLTESLLFYMLSWLVITLLPWMCGVNPDYSLEGLRLKLQLQYFVYLMQWIVTLEKILMLGRNEGQGEWDEWRRDVWMASRIQCTWVSASSWCWWWTRSPGVLQSMGFKQWDITEQMKWIVGYRENALNTSS